MSMRDYEDMKDIVIPKEQEEMMDIVCDAWKECHTLKNCKECPDRKKEFMRMMMCTSLKYTRKFIEAGYTKQLTTDVQEVRHGRWILPRKKGCVTYDEVAYKECSECGEVTFLAKTKYSQMNYCPNCGAKMGGDERC